MATKHYWFFVLFRGWLNIFIPCILMKKKTFPYMYSVFCIHALGVCRLSWEHVITMPSLHFLTDISFSRTHDTPLNRNLIFVRPRIFFYLCLRTLSATRRRRHLCIAISHWPTPCSVIDRKRACWHKGPWLIRYDFVCQVIINCSLGESKRHALFSTGLNGEADS